MLYLFYGTDSKKVRIKALSWVATARKKEPNLLYTRLAYTEITKDIIDEITLSSGLFVKRLLILIDDPFPSTRAGISQLENTNTKIIGNLIEEHIDALASSENAIILLAPSLASAKVKNILDKIKISYKFDARNTNEAIRHFNSSLVNALATRSPKKLWLEINKAFISGDAPEMVHALLHWKARDLMEKGSKVWTPKQARAVSLALINLLQISRRGGLKLSLALEHFALNSIDDKPEEERSLHT